MGKTVTGGSTHEKNIDLLTKDQKKFLSGIIGSKHLTDYSRGAYKDILKPGIERPDMISQRKFEKMLEPSRDYYKGILGQQDDMAGFEKGVVDPMMQQYQQRVLPEIQQRYSDVGAGSSSALNQALAASAGDLTTQLSAQYLPYQQQQQAQRMAAAQGLIGATTPTLQHQELQRSAYGQDLQGILSALSGLGGLAGQQTFSPMISQRQGILGSLIGAGGSIGAAAMMSSKKVKENIRDFTLGLESLKKVEAKKYDYKIEDEEEALVKDRVGLIAEDLPEDVTVEINDVLHVDLYALMALLVNSVKELSEKVAKLEKADGANNNV